MTIALETARPSHVKVATASLIGTAIEWYDFFLYGTAAALSSHGHLRQVVPDRHVLGELLLRDAALDR